MDLISDDLLESAPSHRGGGHGLHIDTAVIMETSKLALLCCVLIAGVLVALRPPAVVTTPPGGDPRVDWKRVLLAGACGAAVTVALLHR